MIQAVAAPLMLCPWNHHAGEGTRCVKSLSLDRQTRMTWRFDEASHCPDLSGLNLTGIATLTWVPKGPA